jgi:hypothetical protein
MTCYKSSQAVRNEGASPRCAQFSVHVTRARDCTMRSSQQAAARSLGRGCGQTWAITSSSSTIGSAALHVGRITCSSPQPCRGFFNAAKKQVQKLPTTSSC